MKMFFWLLTFLIAIQAAACTKEFSLARFSDTLVYANNSVIEIELIGEGTATDGGALECHTDDTNCCRSTDGMAGGDWYGPDGNRIVAPNEDSQGTARYYRTRDHMVIKLNRRSAPLTTDAGVYRCEIPGAGGITITRYITLTKGAELCDNLDPFAIGDITYTPPRFVSPSLPPNQWFIGTIATYSCSSGYKVTGAPSQRACVGETWNGTQPSCQVKCNVSEITNPANGYTSIEGITATYTCNTGYTLEGSMIRTCQDDGTWTPTAPICQIVDCGPLTAPANGQVDTSSGTTFGSTATYTCDTGYTLVGSPINTCGADGNWTYYQPTCQVKDCGPLTAPENGQVDTLSGTTFGSTATYTCDTGYTLSASNRICESTGMWSIPSPSCLIVDCGTLTAPANGQVDTSSGTTFGSTGTYTCDTGYTLVSSPSRTCGADGNWTFIEPTCQILDCGPLTAPANGQVDTSSGTTFGSTATYTCDTGYTLSTTTQRNCGADGNWTSLVPMCERIIFQLRFGSLDCIQYSSSDSLQRIEALSAELVENVVRLCSCYFNSSFLLDPQLQCFPESPQIVTFRAQLSGNGQLSASDLIQHVREWISDSQFTLKGVRLSFNTSCILVIPSFVADECPIAKTDQNLSIRALLGGVFAGVLPIFLTGLLLIVTSTLCICYKHKAKRNRQVRNNQEPESAREMGGESTEYEDISDLVRNIKMRSPLPQLPQVNVELIQCATYSHAMEQSDMDLTQCAAYNNMTDIL